MLDKSTRPPVTYLLSGEKEQYISLVFLAHVDLDDCANRRLQIVPLRLGRVEDLYGMRPAGNSEQGATVEINLELSSVQGGAHDDDLKGSKQTRSTQTELKHNTAHVKPPERKHVLPSTHYDCNEGIKKHQAI